MNTSRRTDVYSAMFVLCSFLLSAGCNPCNDRDNVVQNVNDHAFSGPDFSVVTYNMLHGFGDAINDATLEDRVRILAQEIVDTLPDAVLLQEASVTTKDTHCNVVEKLVDLVNDEIAVQDKGYNMIYARANGTADIIGFEEGSAVMSLYEILSSDLHVYTHNATTLPEFRIALRVTLRGNAGDIDLFGTHLTNLEDTEGAELVRTLQARELAEEIIPGRGNTNPVVVGGDFNDPPESATILEMTDAGAVDMFSDQNPGDPGYTSFPGDFDMTDPLAEADERIDYLFMFDPAGVISDSLLFLDAAKDIDPGPGESWLWGSDHMGVMATFRPAGY